MLWILLEAGLALGLFVVVVWWVVRGSRTGRAREATRLRQTPTSTQQTDEPTKEE